MRQHYDVVVVGGGPSGLTAAVSASRQGATTLLIERYGFLGGMTSAALVYPWFTFHDMTGTQVIGGLAQEIVDRLVALEASPGHLRDTVGFVWSVTPFEREAFKLLALDLVTESGVDLLLHSLVYRTEMAGGTIASVHSVGKYGAAVARGTVYIDATGDADLAFMAGAPTVKGRPQDGKVQGATVLLRLGGVKVEPIVQYMKAHPEEFHHQSLIDELDTLPLTGVSGFFSLWRKAPSCIPRDRVVFFMGPRPGEVLMNTSRVINVDPTDPVDITRAEMEGRRQAIPLVDFLRREVPGFAECYLLEVAPQIGVRESRRIAGSYMLSASDVAAGRRFPDTIALCGEPIDIHAPDSGGMQLQEVHRAYDVPYRILLPQEVDNLLVAGRAVSCTHETFSSLRVTAVAMATGQAAGTAAALSVQYQVAPSAVDTARLREILVQNGAILTP